MEELTKSLDALLKLNDYEGNPPSELSEEEFQPEFYWNNIVGVATRLPHEVTKANVLYQSAPVPRLNETATLWKDIENECCLLTSMCRSFPKAQGATLQTQMRHHFDGILGEVKRFVTDLDQCVSKGKTVSPEPAAVVLEVCEKLKNQCQDNKSAVLILINEQLELAKDCAREFAETIEEMTASPDEEIDDEDDFFLDEEGPPLKWCSREIDLAKATLGLIKATCNCIKKTSEFINANSQQELEAELDAMAQHGGDVSRSLDDLVLELYPVMNVNNVASSSTALTDEMKALLASVRRNSCFSEADAKWNDFLVKALDHNLENIEKLALKSRLG